MFLIPRLGTAITGGLSGPSGGEVVPAWGECLDSTPTNKIGAVGGQDELCMTPMPTFGKSCPQHSGKCPHGHGARPLVRVNQRGDGRRRGPRDVRSGDPAPTPYTDRGVEN